LVDVAVDPSLREAEVAGQRITADDAADLRGRLARALYQRLHVGRAQQPVDPPRVRRDPDIEQRYTAAVPHRNIQVTAPVLDGRKDTLIVALSGLRVAVPTGVTNSCVAGTYVDGPTVDLLLDPTRPALSPGFFLVLGSSGDGLDDGPILRVYIHPVSIDAAVGLWRTALATLEKLAVPYQAKVVSVASDLPRHDGFVVYLGRRGWPAVEPLVAALAAGSGLGDSQSVYAHRVAPGLAVAWDPTDRRAGRMGLSFGEHRSGAIADALLRHARDGVAVGDGDLASALDRCLTEANIDPAVPARNLDSPPLDILKPAADTLLPSG
jgi:hypothetical protein